MAPSTIIVCVRLCRGVIRFRVGAVRQMCAQFASLRRNPGLGWVVGPTTHFFGLGWVVGVGGGGVNNQWVGVGVGPTTSGLGWAVGPTTSGLGWVVGPTTRLCDWRLCDRQNPVSKVTAQAWKDIRNAVSPIVPQAASRTDRHSSHTQRRKQQKAYSSSLLLAASWTAAG